MGYSGLVLKDISHGYTGLVLLLSNHVVTRSVLMTYYGCPHRALR